ncbi:MAG: hypothetical protein J6A77_02075 [Lachnospiraceae bacterium]|nr:hypothetical protein [Lachnospiraceae bacterium]
MEIVWVILALMLVLCLKGMYDKKKNFDRLVARLQKSWGVIPEEEYTEVKFHSLQYYYNHKFAEKKEDRFFLDDITWNDLNMDELFFMLNSTGSAMGEEVLWALLHELKFEEATLKEREKVIQFFQKNEEARLKLATAFALIGKNKKVSIYEYMDQIDMVRQESNLLHYIGAAGIVCSIVLLVFNIGEAGLLLVGFILFNLLTYYRRKGEIEIYYAAISYLIRMLKHAENLAKEDIPELENYYAELRTCTAELKAFRKGAPAVAPQNPTGDMLSFFLDYLRILFHTDLIRFNRMMTQYFAKKDVLVKVFETIGFLDAMCAVASFRTSLGSYCQPEFTEETGYHAVTMYHPFLQKPVPATIQTKRSVLITGSNASGKSTFIKAAAMNAIMAQTIHTVCAESYQASFFKVMTSMALTDNLFGNESYYIVEIKSLKRILDATGGDVPVLCFVDEVLRGTNTVERIAASSRILHSIANTNALMFAATHDIELTYMLEECFENYHFEEKILEDNILFDYQLKNGRATSQNAIALLGLLGYPEEVTAKAGQTAARFLETGEWETIK